MTTQSKNNLGRSKATRWSLLESLALVAMLASATAGRAQESLATQRAVLGPPMAAPTAPATGRPGVNDRPLPINLATALKLANVRPLDIALASQRIEQAAAQLDRAKVLWLPTLYLGADYFRHDGQIQDIRGEVFGTSRQTLMAGAGPVAVFAFSDAIFAPLAERQVVRAREAALQVAVNDSLVAVSEAFFSVQQARGELAGAEDVLLRIEELVRRTEQLAKGLVPPVETVRAKTEQARRRQSVHTARERWRVASAELARVLHLTPGSLLEPLEPPHLQVTLVPLEHPLDELIPLALTNRPELESQQALVQATLERIRQEKLRPWLPNVWLRGASTNPAGTLGAGVFGGGQNDTLSKFSSRSDFDLQLLWELQNLGFGNRARVNERRAENQLSVVELLRLQDRIAAEVIQAHAQVESASARVGEAGIGLQDALDSARKNYEGMSQTRRAGELTLLVIRPQEAVASVQALAQAYADFYGSVADYDRAQFRLYRALGRPAQALKDDGKGAMALPVE